MKIAAIIIVLIIIVASCTIAFLNRHNGAYGLIITNGTEVVGNGEITVQLNDYSFTKEFPYIKFHRICTGYILLQDRGVSIVIQRRQGSHARGMMFRNSFGVSDYVSAVEDVATADNNFLLEIELDKSKGCITYCGISPDPKPIFNVSIK